MGFLGAFMRVAATLGFATLEQVMPEFPGDGYLKHLDWRKKGGCVVKFVYTPCRTIRYHEYAFSLNRTITLDVLEATDQSGSVSKRTVGKSRQWWQLPGTGTSFNITDLLLREEGRTVRIDHQRGVYEDSPSGNRKWVFWEEDDAECSHTVSRYYRHLSGRMPDSTIAGVHVIGYRGRDARGTDYEAYFAPSIGCEEMSYKWVTRGWFGIVILRQERVVESYVLGPPATSLYAVPAGYKRVPPFWIWPPVL